MAQRQTLPSHCGIDIRVGRVRIPLQQADGAHDLAGLAIAALDNIEPLPRRLDGSKDASIPWPDSDEVVELGVITIDKAVPGSLEVQKKLLFLPGQLTEGIEPSDDPLIDVRDGAYAVSFSRRNP